MDGLFTALKEFDFETMLPEIGAYVVGLKVLAWVLLMAAPVVLLVLGIRYSQKPAFDPNKTWAFSDKYTSSDRDLWDKAHALAGKSWKSLGGIFTAVGVLCGVLFFLIDPLYAAMIAVVLLIVELVAILLSKAAIRKNLR